MTDKLAAFKNHGINFHGEVSNQSYGDCAFCGGKHKFYVNIETLLWDCKKCARSGNLEKFLLEVHKRNLESITSEDLKRLSEHRGLPVDSFKSWEIGIYGDTYTMPTYNEKGKLTDIRRYKIGEKFKSTSGCQVNLMGMNHLLKSDNSEAVYLCEGEWDGVALKWLLKELKEPGVVVAVPGASVFKTEWIPIFSERRVHTLYDHDEAGLKGEQIAVNKLTGTVSEIKHVHWPSIKTKGYDTRDYVKEAMTSKDLKKSLKELYNMLRETPRLTQEAQTEIVQQVSNEPIEAVELKEVYETFSKWLFLPNYQGVDMMLATMMSNYLEGDPLWIFLVAPPGGSKTELLNACNECSISHLTSSLTAHSLISGASFAGKDPSLIPRLHGKVLIVKDFTSILNLNENEKTEIFGILRDAYDGHCGKEFGNGVKRYYKSHFTVMAGVTNAIYVLGDQYAGLGERFLKFTIGDNLNHASEEEIIRRSIANVNQETNMRKELATIVKKFIAYRASELTKVIPILPSKVIDKLVCLSQFCARLRGTIMREKYKTDIILTRPYAEFGTRLSKQLSKACMSFALIHGRQEVNEDDYKMAKKLALDTVSQRSEDIIKYLYKETPTINDTVKTSILAYNTKYSISTMSRVLADMDLLDIVNKTGKSNSYEWTLSEYVRGLIKTAEIYD